MRIIGKLHLYSETGTEGGYYAMQNSEKIHYSKPEWGIFKGRTVYDPDDVFRSGKVISSCKRDGSTFNESRPGDVSYLDIEWCDLLQESGRRSDTVFVETWDYEGRVVLKNKDRLTICQSGIGSLALWSGVVELEEQDPYAEASYAPFGLAVHHRPLTLGGITEDEWTECFFKKNWAILER